MLAGVQATALLIAAKRADAIASEVALHTEKNTEDLKTLMAENAALTMRVKQNTDLLEEIHCHVTAPGAVAAEVQIGSAYGPSAARRQRGRVQRVFAADGFA